MDFFEYRERRGESADADSERIASLVIGACIEVHKHLGPGHSEITYRNAVCEELTLRGLGFECELSVNVVYKGKVVGTGRIDLLIGGIIIVELKSVEQLTAIHKGQLLAYLAATNLRLGLLVNFNVSLLKDGIKRVVRDPHALPS